MKRICFVLQVRPERLEQYKVRHRSVWPEMLEAGRETGWANYSAFPFATTECLSAIWKRKILDNARKGMATLKPLEELFHLD